MKRRVPRPTTDEEAETFLDSDLSDLDFTQFKSGRLRLEESSGFTRKARVVPRTASLPLERLAGTGQPPQTEPPVATETYRLFEQAMTEQKPIVCMYEGYLRELCPIILGHTRGEEKALTYQFGGESRSGLPPRGQWKCLFLSKVSNVHLRDGPWRSGNTHVRPQSCVEVVDLDVNRESPYNPKRRLQSAP